MVFAGNKNSYPTNPVLLRGKIKKGNTSHMVDQCDGCIRPRVVLVANLMSWRYDNDVSF